MNDSTYELEWRGARKAGYSYDDIEAALVSRDLHTLYKISVNGRWLLLRDYLEQQRALRVPQPQSPALSPPEQHSVRPPPPPVQKAVPQAFPYQGARAPIKLQKPIWFWPTIILSSTVCLLLAVVLTYMATTSRSVSHHITDASAAPAADVTPAPTTTPSPSPATAPAPASATSSAPAAATTPAPNSPPSTAQAVAATPAPTSATSTAPAVAITPAPTPPPPTVPTAETKPEEKPRQRKFRPASVTGKEIYPSALISMATVDWNGDEQSAEDKKTDEDAHIRKHELPVYGDENGWLGIDLEGLKKGDKVSVEISADGFMKPSKWEGTVTTLSPNGRARINPKIMWDYEALIKVRQQRPFNVIFSTSFDGKALQDIRETYTLRSINDCPFLIKRDKSDVTGENGTSIKFMFAAYVNENHPQVQEVLKEALACRIVKQFDGYQSEDPQQVINQVMAIWNALQRRGIKYSSVTTTTPGDMVFCQTVRFMDQSINSQQANCVDGSVLMASVLQKIGINSYLVIVPSHCFLAFDLVSDSTALPVGLETTLLGDNSITEVTKLDFLPMEERFREYQDSYKTFNGALASGQKKIQQYARILQSGKHPSFALISIEDARKLGIMPIPFTMDK